MLVPGATQEQTHPLCTVSKLPSDALFPLFWGKASPFKPFLPIWVNHNDRTRPNPKWWCMWGRPPTTLLQVGDIWVWLKIKQEGLRRFWSMFPLTRVPFWYRFFEPQPYYKSPSPQSELRRAFAGALRYLEDPGAGPARRGGARRRVRVSFLAPVFVGFKRDAKGRPPF